MRNLILKWAQNREPDFVIGGKETPYLNRHFLVPRNPFFNVYVHQFLRSDDDRAHHDHPWLFNISWLIEGLYLEHTITAGGALVRTLRKAGDWKFRWGKAPHRVELFRPARAMGNSPARPMGKEIPCWTVFVTGPRVREWGFYCMERGWIHWKKFTAQDDKGAVGKGCGA